MAVDRGDQLKPKRDATDRDIQVADANWKAYQRGLDAGHADWLKDARKFDDYYYGEQWDRGVKAQLEAEKRPALTINITASTVNAMLGEHALQRADILFKPRRRGVHETATALTKLTDQTLDNSDYGWKESLVFADGLIEDRGYFDIRMNFDDHIEGEATLTVPDPKTVVLDAQANQYDPTTWNEVTTAHWMSLDDVAVLYGPEKAEALEAYWSLEGDGFFYGPDSVRFAETRFGELDDAMVRQGAMDEGSRKSIRAVRVIERQHKKLARVRRFVDTNTGDTRPVPEGWDDQRAQEFASQFSLVIMTSTEKRIRWTVSAGKCVLFDDWSPYRTFTIVPFFPYFRRGRPFGVVRNLIDPQDQLNKIESQQLHVVNTTANSGWLIESGSLVNMTKDELEAKGATTGLVLEYVRGHAPPEKIQPNQIPTGLDRLGGKAAAWVREISGISDAMLGLDNPEVSGVAIRAKQQRGLTQMQVPFSNLNYTRSLVARKLLELFQDFYTETRVIQVTNWEDPEQSQEDLVINGMTPEGRIINDLTLGEYSVVVSAAPARDTFQESQFAEALELRNAGIMIPDDVVVENSNLAHKYEIAKQIRQAQGRGELTPEQQRIQQLEQSLVVRRALLELEELQGKADKLRAEAAKTAAEAEAEGSGFEQRKFAVETQLRLQEMENDLQAKLAELETKYEIAEMHAESNLVGNRINAATQRIKHETDRVRELAKMRQQNQSRSKESESA